MDADLDTLATAFYVAADDLLKAHTEPVPYRPRIGISPKISDAEAVALALMQALLASTSEARCLRHAKECQLQLGVGRWLQFALTGRCNG